MYVVRSFSSIIVVVVVSRPSRPAPDVRRTFNEILLSIEFTFKNYLSYTIVFVITTTTSTTTDIVIMRVLLTPFGNTPYYVKRHVTRRKVANIKHELLVDHHFIMAHHKQQLGLDNDTSVRNVDVDIDGFEVGSYWEGGKRFEMWIEKAVLRSTKIKLEDESIR